jgi:(1->4)-alpha-D-glucan 1-alpha-D-glucosylmutase
VRVDHVDGLRDPARYLETLAELVPDGTYVVVEKILGSHERLPGWRCDGTTGYEFADAVETAGVDGRGARDLRRFAAATTGERRAFRTTARRAKREAIETLLGAELAALTRHLERLADGRVSAARIRRGVVQATVALDVYRTYVASRGVHPTDRERIGSALEAVHDEDVRALLRDALLVTGPRGSSVADRLETVARWQQLCAPAAAKGIEDTALYRDVALLSRNDVGGDPAHPATAVDDLHAFLADRRHSWPHALSGSSTHDSKRGEDVRARLDVLSEIPDRWSAAVRRWMRMNAAARGPRRRPAPDRTDELMLYKTLVGSWPLHRRDRRDHADRIVATMHKSIREAKRATSWLDPDDAYESGVESFVRTILADRRFTDDLVSFTQSLALHGAVNSLARLVVKATAPGVPDVYQGAELWHLRLVDPDNRAPVDFAHRTRVVETLTERFERDPAKLVRELLARWTDGRIKLFATWRSLAVRASDADLYADGDYVPLGAAGPHARNVIAFARRFGPRWTIVCVPRLSTQIGDGAFPIADAWGDTRVHLPDDAPVTLSNAFTTERVTAHERAIAVREACQRFPVALLTTA